MVQMRTKILSMLHPGYLPAGPAMQTMLQMKKLDIAELERAAQCNGLDRNSILDQSVYPERWISVLSS
jgi:hypothetical protein